MDLATIEKQILTGYYKTVEAFDGDMLKVFRNAEVRMPSRKATAQALWVWPELMVMATEVLATERERESYNSPLTSQVSAERSHW